MRLHELAHQIINKFNPMADKDALLLQQKASSEYYSVIKKIEDREEIIANNARLDELTSVEGISTVEFDKLINEIKEVPKETMVMKVIGFADKWYMQYALGIIFIWLTKMIQDALNAAPKPDRDDFDGEHDD